MLEKIGLPPKPSQRGNNWVIDASHCQGCSSQFTFINRKHHCRRCGGLFCSSCTQQRMVLRGQGDSPVRICEPCKKLEEAARFEMRYGHKNRTGRGALKLSSTFEDDVLNQIVGSDSKESVPAGRESPIDMLSNIQRATSSSSCSNTQQNFSEDEGAKVPRSLSVDSSSDVLTEVASPTPEELRQAALDEKKKYKILKSEGKSEEALRAFKRGKELERQAGALEIHLRRSRKRTMSSGIMPEIQKIKDQSNEAGRKIRLPPQVMKEKDDLSAELRELGWSDVDLHNADKKPGSISLEGELASLLKEVSHKTNTGMGTPGIDKSEVVAHKKRALALKREGKLSEAKEELKKAKLLEKQIEEQELLAGAEDSDDELSYLIRSMDADKQNEFSTGHEGVHGSNFDHLPSITDDIEFDSNFEVTNEDMNDPEIVAALKSIGWAEDPDEVDAQSTPIDKEALSNEILTLKKEALYQKRAGNTAEAMAILRKAKVLEKDLVKIGASEINSMEHDFDMPQKSSNSHLANKPSNTKQLDGSNVDARNDMDLKVVPKSRMQIQKELLSLKKRALTLRREGRLDEADEELKKGKVLERQLEEIDNALKVKASPVKFSNKHTDTSLHMGDEDKDEDVTDQDLNDPTYLSVLKNLGWQDDDNENLPSLPSKENDRPLLVSKSSVTEAPTVLRAGASRRSKSEIQKELLGLKRKSLALRRQGEAEEAEKVLKVARQLEVQLEEIDTPEMEEEPFEHNNRKKNEVYNLVLQDKNDGEDQVAVSEEDMHDPKLLSVLKNLGWQDDSETVTLPENPSESISWNPLPSDVSMSHTSPKIAKVVPRRSKAEIQKELLGMKRKALALRQQGATEESEELLRMSRVLEVEMEGLNAPTNQVLADSFKKEGPENELVISTERHASLKDAIDGNLEKKEATGLDKQVIEWPEDLGLWGKDIAKPPLRSVDISVHEDDNRLLVDVGPSGEAEPTKETRISSPVGQSESIMDLLTGDNWNVSPASDDNANKNINSSSPLFDSLGNTSKDLKSKDEVKRLKTDLVVRVNENTSIAESNASKLAVSSSQCSSIQQNILAHKRKAVVLKREGKLAEAKEELRQAKLLEKCLEEDTSKAGASSHSPVPSDVPSSNVASVQVKEQGPKLAPKPLSSRDRFKLQQESLSHKRQALKLRREGRAEEAEAEFELAKALENQLEEQAAHDSSKSTEDDVSVDDFLDPQLLSALKAIGMDDASMQSQGPGRPEPTKSTSGKVLTSGEEKTQLEEQIKAEKVRAVNLKRSGKQAEALDALRRAKFLEKKLNSLASQ